MKKLILISLLMLILSLTAAAAEVEVGVSSVTAACGDEVSLTFSVRSAVTVNSVAFRDFTFDEDALELVGFEACEGLGSITQLPAHLDLQNRAVVIGLKTAVYNTELFRAVFKVKDRAGDFEVGATVITKNSSTPLTNKLTKGVISVPPVAHKGTSLVLDGAIGIKTYFAIAKDVSLDETVVEIYDNAADESLSVYAVTPQYDSKRELYYTVGYVAPKDADNCEIRIALGYTLNGNKGTLEAAPVTVKGYIDAFKELAENDPDSEFGKALELVETMEVYTKYADSFFGQSAPLEDVTADTEAIERVSDPVISGTLSDIELYATSLILEDKTTIRHYFKYSGDYTSHTFKAGNRVLTPKRKGELIYVDVEDIAAQDMDVVYTVTVSDTVSVDYCVLNYVKQAVDSSDKKLSNLVKALYNYYVQAESYAK